MESSKGSIVFSVRHAISDLFSDELLLVLTIESCHPPILHSFRYFLYYNICFCCTQNREFQVNDNASKVSISDG